LTIAGARSRIRSKVSTGRCRSCGAEVTPGARFCSSCGSRVDVESLAPEQRVVVPSGLPEGMGETYAEDIELIDHRGVERQSFQGCDAVLEQAASVRRHPCGETEVSSEELLASDGRGFASVASYRVTAEGRGGGIDLALGQVGLISEGRIEHLEWFDPYDRQAMLVRYAELGGGARLLGDGPPERWFKELLVAYARADVVKLVDLHAEGWRNTDHRNVGWYEAQGGEEIAHFSSSPFEVADEHFAEVEEVLGSNDRVIAARVAYRGRSKDGDHELLLRVASVSVIESGLRISADLYDPGQRQAVLGRYVELTGRRSPR
jgi:hypothetical protein